MPAPSVTPLEAKPEDPSVLISEVAESLRQTAQEVVPWFLRTMPLVYFQDTDHAAQLAHLRAIIAAKASGRPIELTLRSEDGSQWTLMRPLDYPGVLAELVGQLPHDVPLRAAKIHTATDGQLVLDTFEFGRAAPFDPTDPAQAQKLEETIAYARTLPGKPWSPDDLVEHFHRCSGEYVLTVTPIRLCQHLELFQQVTGTDSTAVSLEPERGDPTQCRIVVALGNATRRRMLERIATRLSRSSINIHRAYLDLIDDGANGAITQLGFVVQGPDGGPIDPDSELWAAVRRDLLRLKWLDKRVLDLAYRHAALGLTRAEVILALCELTDQVLAKANPYAFNPDRILRLAERNLAQTTRLADLFMHRFDPADPLDDQSFRAQIDALRAEIDSDVDLEDARTLLHALTDAVCAVRRTNLHVESRYALSLRLDPAFLVSNERPEVPFGVFYVHGRQFNGFHVRFRDIARGGVRAVCPIGADQHAREAERLYDEAYHLAHAQQLKNKDIPEGGAKAAILLEPTARLPRSVKAFIDAILDLITPDPDTRRQIIDRDGAEELLYFGPDENITPELIEWIIDRARRRGYPAPTALMSSKPGAGINHKEYGVTSEGVTVFLDVTLRECGIDPTTTPFTLKITGGPDGDVAGNEIRILHREYGAHARILGIADRSGAAEDPAGLDHEELLRLADQSLPISHFDRARLGPEGRVVALEEPDGVHLRNTLCNRLVTDAFIPAGGRPNTLHEGNWREHLGEDGQPVSKVIVEGANLFLTPEARRHLSEAGVLIVKDSSANKCGVICSSFEIMASMLLSEKEFLGIKDRFVREVLEKLRSLARREAELLMRLYHHHPQSPLPELSTRLSRVMLRAADAIGGAIDALGDREGDLVRSLVVDHLPPVLIETAGDRLWSATPQPYLQGIIAKSLAARIVYREGFEYLETMPVNAIVELAGQYLQLELERTRLMSEVRASSLPSRDRIAEVLERAGIISTLGGGQGDPQKLP